MSANLKVREGRRSVRLSVFKKDKDTKKGSAETAQASQAPEPEPKKPAAEPPKKPAVEQSEKTTEPEPKKPAAEPSKRPAVEHSEKTPAEPEKPAEPDWKALYAITLADFDNYKKRAARDREDVYRYAESDILKDILPSVDNLSLALDHAKDKEDEFVKGVRLVYDGILKTLSDHGAKPMGELVGKELDPNFHEAIATLPSAEIEEGRISNVVKMGWTLNDKLLRAAQVVVSAGRPAEVK